MSREIHINKPSEAAVNTAGALNALLKAIARYADASDDRVLKYAEAFMALAKSTGARVVMTHATIETPFSSWWREMKEGDGPWEFSIGMHRFGVWNVGCVVMNCLTCRKTFGDGISQAHPPNWDFTEQSVAHMQSVASAHAKGDSSGASARVPEKPSRDAADKITELEQLVAQLTDERRAAAERHVADEAMLRDALGKERNKSHTLEVRIGEKDAQIERLTHERAQGRDDSWRRGYESARRDIDATKHAHAELLNMYEDLLDIRRRLGTELSTRTDERDALRAQIDSMTRRLEQQSATIAQLRSQLTEDPDPTRL